MAGVTATKRRPREVAVHDRGWQDDVRLVAEQMALKELARERLRNPPLVVVTWEDAYGTCAYRSLSDLRDDQDECIVRSVGFLLRDDERAVRIVQSISDNLGSDALTIPRAMVRSITHMPVSNGR